VIGRPRGGDGEGHRGRRRAAAPRRCAPITSPSPAHVPRVTLDLAGVPRPGCRPRAHPALSPAGPTRNSPRSTSSTAGTCSSRARGRATQPANLQGIWNDTTNPPWASNYTRHQYPDELLAGRGRQPGRVRGAAFRDDRRAGRTGARTARRTTEPGLGASPPIPICGGTRPGGTGRAPALWPTGGRGWPRISGSTTSTRVTGLFLARAYPIMKGAAEFFLDTLVEDPSGRYLVTSPSSRLRTVTIRTARWRLVRPWTARFLRDLFGQVIEAGRSPARTRHSASRCPPPGAGSHPIRIGAGGQLQVARGRDMTAPEPKHRHVSHLYAVYPSAHCLAATTPALTAAVGGRWTSCEATSYGWRRPGVRCGPGCAMASGPTGSSDHAAVPRAHTEHVSTPTRRSRSTQLAG